MQSQTMPEQRSIGLKYVFFLILIVSISVFSAFPAYSHRVNVFAYVEGDTIYTESYFYDGSPVKEGKIEVFESSNKSLLSGKTDSDGFFSFEVPKIDDLTIVLDATMGHRATFLITADELKQQLPDGMTKKSVSKLESKKSSDSKTGKTADGMGLDTPQQKEPGASQKVTLKPIEREKGFSESEIIAHSVNVDDIRLIVRDELSQELGPIHRAIARLEKQKGTPSVTEIFGGIGYIVGLAGLALFFKSRAKK